MSKFRPECGDGKSKMPLVDDADALYRIREAVRDSRGLGWGKLYDKETGEHCAIGAYDSIPQHLSPRTRRNRVLAWLNYRVDVLRGKIMTE